MVTDPRMAAKKPQRSRLEKLRNSWEKAAAPEREAFLAWLREKGDLQSSEALPEQAPIATGRYLTPAAAQRMRATMAERSLDFKDLLVALGLPRNDRTLARAMLGRTALKLSVVAAIEAWLNAEDETRQVVEPDQ